MAKTAQDREIIDRRAGFQKLMPVKATRHATLYPAASSSSGVHMTSALHIVCPHCDSINRVPRQLLRDGGKCGSCHRPLFERRPVALNSVARFSRLLLLSASY
jgi:uncharacterized paraquat-inducible protein A